MGKKKDKAEYNDFLDGEKLRDNADVRTTLQGSNALTGDVSPPPPRRDKKGRGKKGKGGPKKPPLTHFLCLPLVSDKSAEQLEASLEKLRDELRRTELVPLEAVRPVGTLHLTLGVMSLDAERLGAANQCLQGFDIRSLLRDIGAQKLAEKAAEAGTISENLGAAAFPDTEALAIDLKSLVPMQAPHKTSILYAEPRDASQRLYPFGVALRDYFREKGFLVEDKRALKLHATIVNTIYAKSAGRSGRGRGKAGKHKEKHVEESAESPSTGETEAKAAEEHIIRSQGHGPNAKSWMRFDARELVERCKDFVLAEGVVIDRVQICKMGAKKILREDGEVVGEEYEVVAEKVI
ncbi:hypothetical protein BU26DRAFT_414937 [Trematosphaeria pertusa]|uniref:A-kinase anchor protein 7-like phosphoesterase domain-containing protein n=1 Tax=Trematosphaeria pertusa TaxID=390896 RepID=A0A6A6J1S6_9PLEO|nr:uncharacterized protein BU26DRAFT_414937 [Trematosphaeria pertusa]KAF2256825.1 hypothetical protein BU26DRAFT_414937 [Trematosphaeria pertusa]